MTGMLTFRADNATSDMIEDDLQAIVRETLNIFSSTNRGARPLTEEREKKGKSRPYRISECRFWSYDTCMSDYAVQRGRTFLLLYYHVCTLLIQALNDFI